MHDLQLGPGAERPPEEEKRSRMAGSEGARGPQASKQGTCTGPAALPWLSAGRARTYRTGADVVASRHARVSACGRCGPISERPVASADISLSIAGAYFVPPAESSGLARGGPAACPRTGGHPPRGEDAPDPFGRGLDAPRARTELPALRAEAFDWGAVRPRCAYWGVEATACLDPVPTARPSWAGSPMGTPFPTPPRH